MAKTILFTQPELSVSMTGGFAALTPIVVSVNHENGFVRMILWVTLLAMLALFTTLAFILGKRRAKLEISDDFIKHGKRQWASEQIRQIEWNARYRRVMIRPHKGFGLGMTLLKETVDQDSEYFLSWAATHKISVIPK